MISPICSFTVPTTKRARESASSKKRYVYNRIRKHGIGSSNLVAPRICINLNLVAVFLEAPGKTKNSRSKPVRNGRELLPIRRAPEHDGAIRRPAAAAHRGLERSTVRPLGYQFFFLPKGDGEGKKREMGAYELEEGGVLEVRVGVQRSLQQQPPWARERRRGGATAGHLCLSPPPAVSPHSH